MKQHDEGYLPFNLEKGKDACESTLINMKPDDAGDCLCLFENFHNTDSVLNLRESFN